MEVRGGRWRRQTGGFQDPLKECQKGAPLRSRYQFDRAGGVDGDWREGEGELAGKDLRREAIWETEGKGEW